MDTRVSHLSTDQICDYFASKGNPVSEAVLQTPEFLDFFIRNVRVDYSCLETYPATSTKLRTPLVVIGGGLDPGVSINDLEAWKRHTAGYKGGDAEDTKDRRKSWRRSNMSRNSLRSSMNKSITRRLSNAEDMEDTRPSNMRRNSLRSSMNKSITRRGSDAEDMDDRRQSNRRRSTIDDLRSSLRSLNKSLRGSLNHTVTDTEEALQCNVITKVYQDQGHFYLNEEQVLADLGDFLVNTVNNIQHQVSKTKEDLDREAEVKKHVTDAFEKALGMPMTSILHDEHFFNALGGSSLDTMVLTAHIQSTLSIRVTQDVFLLNPTLNSLTERIVELQRQSSGGPQLDPIELKEGEDGWFPASAGQVRDEGECIYTFTLDSFAISHLKTLLL